MKRGIWLLFIVMVPSLLLIGWSYHKTVVTELSMGHRGLHLILDPGGIFFSFMHNPVDNLGQRASYKIEDRRFNQPHPILKTLKGRWWYRSYHDSARNYHFEFSIPIVAISVVALISIILQLRSDHHRTSRTG